MSEIVSDYGPLLVFLLIAGQCVGLGVLPGNTALIAGAVLASRGRFSIETVIAAGALGGIVGGGLGYWVGLRGGRLLVDRFLPARLEPLLEKTEVFLARRGMLAVFCARFLAGVKVVVAPAAGLARMPWWPFLLAYSAASISVALLYGLGAYYAGEATVALAERYGFLASLPLLAAGGLLGLGWLLVRRGHFAAPLGLPSTRGSDAPEPGDEQPPAR